MATAKKNLRICEKGHHYYKSSDCPVCPVCANEEKPDDDFLSRLGAPARRALMGVGIATVQHLSTFSKTEILKLHGMGPSSIPKLLNALEEKGLSFKNN